MAEIISIFTSTLTLAEVAGKGAKVARQLHQAPNGLQKLQESLQLYRTALEHVEAVPSKGDFLSQAIMQGDATLTRLEALVEKKLTRRLEGVVKVRKRAWVKNQSKIRQLTGAIKETNELILLALVASNA
jgi:maltooligosyltrehalose synthase